MLSKTMRAPYDGTEDRRDKEQSRTITAFVLITTKASGRISKYLSKDIHLNCSALSNTEQLFYVSIYRFNFCINHIYSTCFNYT